MRMRALDDSEDEVVGKQADSVLILAAVDPVGRDSSSTSDMHP